MKLLIILGVSLLLFVSSTLAVTSVSSCRTLNYYGETYQLSAKVDADEPGDPCFSVTNSYITLDLNGYDIHEDASSGETEYGVYVGPVNNVREFTITGNSRSDYIHYFPTSVYFDNCYNCDINSITVQGDTASLYIKDSYVTVDDVSFRGSADDSVEIDCLDSEIDVTDSTISPVDDGGEGIHLNGCDDSSFDDVSMRRTDDSTSTEYLIRASDSDDVTFSNLDMDVTDGEYASDDHIARIEDCDNFLFDSVDFESENDDAYTILLTGTTSGTTFRDCKWYEEDTDFNIYSTVDSILYTQYGIEYTDTDGSILWNDTGLFDPSSIIDGVLCYDSSSHPDLFDIYDNFIRINYTQLTSHYDETDVFLTLTNTPSSGFSAPVMALNNVTCTDETDPYCINTTPLTAETVIFYTNPSGRSSIEYKLMEDPCESTYTNTSWSDWYANGSCLINDSYDDIRNLTQYDSNECPASVNSTFYESRYTTCDYCTPFPTNTSWTSWYEETTCYVNNTQYETRNLTEYDSNSCYSITSLGSDIFENTTYNESQWDACSYLYGITINNAINNLLHVSTLIFNVTTASEAYQCTLNLNGTEYLNNTNGTSFLWNLSELSGNYTLINVTCCYDPR